MHGDFELRQQAKDLRDYSKTVAGVFGGVRHGRLYPLEVGRVGLLQRVQARLLVGQYGAEPSPEIANLLRGQNLAIFYIQGGDRFIERDDSICEDLLADEKSRAFSRVADLAEEAVGVIDKTDELLHGDEQRDLEDLLGVGDVGVSMLVDAGKA